MVSVSAVASYSVFVWEGDNMIAIFLLTQVFNPSFTAGILIPDDQTDNYVSHIYHFELENSFTDDLVAPGIFIDFFYNSAHPYDDPYFFNSGLPLIVKAWGGGLQLKINPFRNIGFNLNFGYYAGEFSYPVPDDSGGITRNKDHRRSLGATVAFNLSTTAGKLRYGIKFYVNVIPFGARKYSGIWEDPPDYYDYRLQYASLNTVGIGFLLGLHEENKK